MERWVFVIKSQDQPGVLTTATSVFSNRGVSLETILGSGGSVTGTEEGRFVLSFRASKRQQELLLRTLERLSAVKQVQVYPYTSPQLRAIAVVRLAQGMEVTAKDVQVEVIDADSQSQTLLLTGSTSIVEQMVEQFQSQNRLLDVALSIVAV